MRNSFFSIIKESAHQAGLAVGISLFANASQSAFQTVKRKAQQIVRAGASSPPPEVLENISAEASKVIAKPR